MDISHVVIIFFAGFGASIFGTLVGGSSLVTIPTLLLLGLSPHTAIGTDRFGIMGVCAAGWYQFHKKRLINYRVGITLVIPVLFGAFIGANLVFEIIWRKNGKAVICGGTIGKLCPGSAAGSGGFR